MIGSRKLLGIVLLILCAAQFAAAQSSGELDVIQLRPNFYMIAGAGSNVGVQIGSDGVVLVDAGAEAASDRLLAAIRKLTPLPTRYIINTGSDADHVSGNARMAKAGLTIFTTATGASASLANAMTNGGGAAILAHDSILKRMSAPTGKVSPYPAESQPTEAFYTDRKSLRLNDEAIEVLYQPAAHNAADSFVFFRKSDVVFAGDILDMTRFPVIDVANGGSIQGEIEALNRLIELAVPAGPFIFKGAETYVIPGHGRACEQLDVVNYRDMVVIIRDVVAAMMKDGMTLGQIKQAHPARAYETQYGVVPGSTDGFIEAIYSNLTATK